MFLEKEFRDILNSCEAVLTEEKNSNKERLVLYSVTRNLKKYVQSAFPPKHSSTEKDLSRARSAPREGREETVSSDVGSVQASKENKVGASMPPVAQPAVGTPSAEHLEELYTVSNFLKSADDINQLCYACCVTLIGDRESGGGSIAKGSSRLLMASLELAAAVLHSGIVPLHLEAAVPLYTFSSSNSGGSKFFLKLIGQTKKTAQVDSSSMASASKRNVRIALEDAVLAATDSVFSKDTTEKLQFVFINTLLAAAVPHLSRLDCSNTPHFRSNLLSMHADRLMKVLRLLFSFLSRPATSSILLDEVKRVIHLIVKSISQSVERHRSVLDDSMSESPLGKAEHREASKGAEEGSPIAPAASCGAKREQHAASDDRGSYVLDLTNVLELCSSIARNAPLSLSPSTATPSATGEVSGPSTSGDTNEGVRLTGTSDDDMRFNKSYLTLVTALNIALYLTVNGGPAFRNKSNVIDCIKNSLIPAAVRASLSSDFEVFRLSLNILLTCELRFGAQLVNETYTIFRHVYFRVLDSKFTTVAQKSLVIDAFQSYIEEPHNLISLFLNYDCNTHSLSVYEEMIHYLGALARPTSKASDTSARPRYNDLDNKLTVRLEWPVPQPLRRKALLTLLLVSESNIQWIERFDFGADESRSAPIASDVVTTLLHSSGTYESIPDNMDVQEEVNGRSDTMLTQNQKFLEARRYKDAFKSFLYLFNNKASPKSAIEFLNSSILVLQPSMTDSNDLPDKDEGNTNHRDPNATPHPAPREEPLAAAAGAEEEAAPIATGEQQRPDDGDPSPPTDEKADASGEDKRNEKDETHAGAEEVGTDAGETSESSVAKRTAEFLKENEDFIDKVILGDYFSKCYRDNTTKAIFEAWIKLHDFTKLSLDEALRLFLGGFKLLGEAQVVDRTMELFASHYCHQNPTVFSSADTAFVLSFSICMLNTDAHSRHVKNKMTFESFVKNNKGIDEGNDLDMNLLKGIYDRITKREIVLRPSTKCSVSSPQNVADHLTDEEDANKSRSNVLESIPILRHLSPIAAAFTDKVLLPMNAAGIFFGSSSRKREELYQEELKGALKEVMSALQGTQSSMPGIFLSATSIENALPMWEITVDLLCILLVASLEDLYESAESYDPSSTAISGVGNSAATPGSATAKDSTISLNERVAQYMQSTQSENYYQNLLQGLKNTMRVCCLFGNMGHTDMLLEHCYDLTELSQTVYVESYTEPRISVRKSMSRARLQLLNAFLNLFIAYGAYFTSRGWQAGYSAVSLLDALANGSDGMWRRQNARLVRQQKSSSSQTFNPSTKSTPPDTWFGNLQEVPRSIEASSVPNRIQILSSIRDIRKDQPVDLWLEKIFDASRYPSLAQMQMANGLALVCQKELQCRRTFSVTKLFDFVNICASISSRLQWRDLWSNASVVFVNAGEMSADVALPVLDGLRLIALSYLMLEELSNYTFQKDVLRPFEAILTANTDTQVRLRVIDIIAELIDLRAAHLASGWHIAFSCLSHAAVYPQVAETAWRECVRIMSRHIDYIKDCFGDLIFCLTSFSCGTETIALSAVSYLVACGHWLQYGLEPPPSDVTTAEEVLRWASRFRSARVGTLTAQTLDRHFTRVTLAPEPLTSSNLLNKPSTFTNKTVYHLWCSLFEGMVPILVIHESVRVRAHTISCMWYLLKLYGETFSDDVLVSLFHGMLCPVLQTLATQVPAKDSTALDRMDYRILLSLALRGMFSACASRSRTLRLACETLVSIILRTDMSAEPFACDFVDIVVRICEDIMEAVHEARNGSASDDTPALFASFDFASQPTSFFTHAHETCDYTWLTEQVDPFFLGLLHENKQIGRLDIVHLKRSAGWTELHSSETVGSSKIRFPSFLFKKEVVPDACSLTIYIQQSVSDCFVKGLLPTAEGFVMGSKTNREMQLMLFSAYRHIMFGITHYTLITQDIEGFSQLLECAVVTEDKTVDEASMRPIEYLLLTPFKFVLVDLILNCLGEEFRRTTEPLVAEKADLMLHTMTEARDYCMNEESTSVLSAEKEGSESRRASISHADSNRRDCVLENKSFKDVFKACLCTDISARGVTYSSTRSANERKRVFFEWLYLTHVLTVRCTLALSKEHSALYHQSASLFFGLLRVLPSDIEEHSIGGFLRSCWSELNLHCSMPEETALGLCVGCLQRTVAL
ncbi:hypothetical protein STCU_04922 [Strigomonas culicis]|uniref:SEC7 domain-containing protein n=1 Tax=Strigomonas culicis TaxID=28005 RepID=S9VYF6_9TRYP|nr:hypothetical protein STCU_04922 [Strigomonas culicis]|eukprot:EPY28705.1 hypothetical protein STCU_04922 [Strigomonas culicis]